MMAQTKGLVKFLQIKIANITSQKDQLHGVLDDYVHRMTSKAREMLEKEEQNITTLEELHLTMDALCRSLIDITIQMEDNSSPHVTGATGVSSTPSSSSSSLSEPSSAMLPKKSHDPETDEVSKLPNRIEVLESAFTACRNEMSQTTTQMTHAKDQLDTRCLRLEEQVQLLTNQSQETERKQAVKFESMDKKIGDCQRQSQAMDKKIGDCKRQSQENDQRLANLENHVQKLDDITRKVEDISTQLGKTERSETSEFVGFTAYHSYVSDAKHVLIPGSHVKDFSRVYFNTGNHFNPFSGEFICPIDGVYVVSTTIRQLEDGVIDVDIKRQSEHTATPTTEVCRVRTDLANTSSCGVAVVRLQAGDRVFVQVSFKDGNAVLTACSSFSCFQIG